MKFEHLSMGISTMGINISFRLFIVHSHVAITDCFSTLIIITSEIMQPCLCHSALGWSPLVENTLTIRKYHSWNSKCGHFYLVDKKEVCNAIKRSWWDHVLEENHGYPPNRQWSEHNCTCRQLATQNLGGNWTCLTLCWAPNK